MKHFCDSGEPVNGKVVKRVKGGLVVDLGVIQAFLPGSQADVQPIKNFDDLINKEFDFSYNINPKKIGVTSFDIYTANNDTIYVFR